MSASPRRPMRSLSLLLPLVLAACTGSSGGTEPGGEGLLATVNAQADLDAARATWVAQEPPAYRYVLRRSCECLPDATRGMRVQVRRHGGAPDEIVETVAFANDGNAVPEGARPPVLTVDQLFALVQRAIDRRAASVVVRYDERLGYPRSIAIDYDLRMADEEDFYVASDLEAVP